MSSDARGLVRSLDSARPRLLHCRSRGREETGGGKIFGQADGESWEIRAERTDRDVIGLFPNSDRPSYDVRVAS